MCDGDQMAVVIPIRLSEVSFFVFLNPHNTTFKWSLLQMKNTGV